MKLRIIVSREAREEIERAGRWWRENRPLNPSLFRRELAQARSTIAELPELAPRVGTTSTRRLLLPRTQYFLFYRYEPTARTIFVVMLWHTARGAKPRL